jgi:hypothetical protein
VVIWLWLLLARLFPAFPHQSNASPFEPPSVVPTPCYLRATGLPTCLLIHFGKAKIEVRRSGMSPGRGTEGIELEVKDIQ